MRVCLTMKPSKIPTSLSMCKQNVIFSSFAAPFCIFRCKGFFLLSNNGDDPNDAMIKMQNNAQSPNNCVCPFFSCSQSTMKRWVVEKWGETHVVRCDTKISTTICQSRNEWVKKSRVLIEIWKFSRSSSAVVPEHCTFDIILMLGWKILSTTSKCIESHMDENWFCAYCDKDNFSSTRQPIAMRWVGTAVWCKKTWNTLWKFSVRILLLQCEKVI
jgi:hypothetical protein